MGRKYDSSNDDSVKLTADSMGILYPVYAKLIESVPHVFNDKSQSQPQSILLFTFRIFISGIVIPSGHYINQLARSRHETTRLSTSGFVPRPQYDPKIRYPLSYHGHLTLLK